MPKPVGFQPAEIKSVTYTHTTGTDFDKKIFTGPALKVIGLASRFNRIPELHSVQGFLKASKS